MPRSTFISMHRSNMIKHHRTPQIPCHTSYHSFPFIIFHYHLSIYVVINSLVNCGTRHYWLCLFVVHLPCSRCIVRECSCMCVCVCAPAIKKWSRTESRNIFDIVGTRMGHALFFSLWFILPCLGAWYAHLLSNLYLIWLCLYLSVGVCFAMNARISMHSQNMTCSEFKSSLPQQFNLNVLSFLQHLDAFGLVQSWLQSSPRAPYFQKAFPVVLF